MKKSIVSRIVAGYGYLALLLLCLVFATVLHVSIGWLGNAEAGVLRTIVRPAQSLFQAVAERRGIEPEHAALVRALESSETLPGRFFLPESLAGRYERLRSQALRELAPLPGSGDGLSSSGTAEIRSYLQPVRRLLDGLEDYAARTNQFRARLEIILLAIIGLLALTGFIVGVLYFLVHLPALGRDYRTLLRYSRGLAEGSVQQRPELGAGAETEVGDLLRQLAELQSLKLALGQIQDQAEAVLQASVEVEGTSNATYEAQGRQADLLERIAGGVAELTTGLRSVREQSRSNHEAAAATGGEIESSAAEVLQGEEDATLLEQQTTQIEESASLIADIADQTDLLALNASIEAARAGEYGRGFNVVAAEVQKLADRSARAAREISELVQAVREVVRRIASRFAELNTAIATVGRGVRQAAEGAGDLSQRSAGVTHSVEELGISVDASMDLCVEVLTNADGVSMAFQVLRENAEKLTRLAQAGEGTGRVRDYAPPALPQPRAAGKAVS
jgi:methyl-accepting chemotaxis protein